MLTTLFSCSKDNWALADDEYVFVDWKTVVYANIIDGDKFTHPAISQPTYIFDDERNELSFYEHDYGHFNFDALEVIKGSQMIMTGGIGVNGGGEAGGLKDYYNIPTENRVYSILDLNSDGTIHLSLNDGTPVTLGVREEWIDITKKIESHDYYDGNSYVTTIVEITTTRTITNYGILKKSGIKILH